ncbi:inorganic phosphate transporter [Natronobacterium gregoryi]|uniref:Phosphate transporter n=2 Tax=Natronobacterium gregoryi TaxID=44930 RepID=L0AIQ0_NATGS|nr:inorganic phosphate transporter [Natronobacterium gregoryi]AFZ72945.1 phosphate/sulfate permease [Natronobacterium gregoryi SP2]ELY69907.1 phosphate transporter [Natronobacterium gregoryi SP2]PLK21830.1 inorganic phosphate transporter [Natronobacterium gregoryi SP2]SFI68223.1 inorganic phosphate transporter, PiT family [Natronobacterium gregoryi]
MISTLLLIGILVAIFVGYNIGGATTGPAFGPAVGADAISKTMAGALMTIFFFVGAWTIGRRVVDTLGRDLVHDPGVFTLEASVAVLFFIGVALFVGNVFGVPASTSMTAVGSIAGLGLAAGELDWGVMGEIAIWWIVSPFIGFWVSLIIGRYFYAELNRRIAMERSEGPLFEIDRSGIVPTPGLSDTATVREAGGVVMVIVIGCLMAYSSGTSNIANAVAPLVGSGELEMNPAIIIGCLAVGIGTFTIARRTLETMGNELTELPLTAAIVTATVSATLVIFLSAIGIPASFVIIATMCIIGLGWGRATRPITVSEAVRGEESAPVSVGALSEDREGEELPPIGEEKEPERIPKASDLFDPATTARVVLMQNVVPAIATLGAYATFRFVPIFGI